MTKRRGFFTEYLLLWVIPTLWKGARNNLNADDVPDLPDSLRSRTLIPKAITAWEEKKNLWYVVWCVAKQDLIIGLCASIVSGLVTVVAKPLVLKLIIADLDDENSDESGTLKLIGIMIIVVIFEGFSMSAVKHSISDIAGQKLFTSISGLIQNKIKKLPISTQHSSEFGLIGNDLFRIWENLRWGCMLVQAFVAVIAGITMLVIQLGFASIPGISVMAIILVANIVLGHYASFAEEKDLKAADVRLQYLKQMISGIKAIKLCAWEESFLKNILEVRKVEMRHLARYRFLTQVSVQIGRACSILAAAASFVFFALSGDDVSAATLFSALNVFLAMRLGMIVIPESVTIVGAMRVSFKRISDYLEQQEISTLPLANLENELKRKSNPAEIEDTKTGLEMFGKFSWPDSNKFCIDIGSTKISLPKGSSLAVVAKVGGGKTTFVHGALNELVRLGPDTALKNMHGYTAYVPQHAYILGGTVLENIKVSESTLLDAEVEEALVRSAMISDLKMLRNGLKTTIGERGINFSGGQQQRLSIARAVYMCLKHKLDPKGSLLVVDDPLAAVDVSVGDHVFHKAFMQHIRDNPNNSLIMALNQPKYLKHFDYILYMENGKVSSFLPVNPENLVKLGYGEHAVQTVLAENAQSEDNANNTAGTEAGSSSGASDDDLYQADYNAKGNVALYMLKQYANSIGWCFVLACLISGMITYGWMAFSDYWFSLWADHVDSGQSSEADDRFFVGIYVMGCAMFLTFLLITATLFTSAGVKGSSNLHKQGIMRLLHCPISFFEKTPSGRIISRFSSDLSAVDLSLSKFCDYFWQINMTLLAEVVIVSIVIPPMLAVIVLAILLYYALVLSADRANRVIKRENNIAMGPLQLAVSESSEAKVSARLMNLEEYFDKKFYEAIDNWSKFGFSSLGLVTTSFLASYVISLVISTSAGLFIVLSGTLSPSLAGLALTYSFLIPYFLLYSGFNFTLVMAALNSLERIVDYTAGELPQEPEWYSESKRENVICNGKIEFKNVSLVYRPGLPPALRDLSFTINPAEKIGIIGRTGAGKSSVILLLMRIIDPSQGCILFDNIDIRTIGLLELRKSISIIPQTPLLLKGTVKDNMTPFGEASFELLKLALMLSGLFYSVHSGAEVSTEKLLAVLDLDAESLSSGQKQLLSLSRCLLNTHNRVLILDEPTSNVDLETDKIVQKVVRDQFAKATTITIAHRLETIADVDRIIVLHQGTIKTIGSPQIVLKSEKV